MAPSTRPYMGATLFDDAAGKGATFRVWAPFASAVCVAGDFNAWSAVADPLSSEDNGYWSTDIPGDLTNKQYLFVLTNPAFPGPLWRMDPYARSIALSGGTMNAVIATSDESLADAPGYVTPAWNEMVIYEIDVRTFASDPGGPFQDENGVRTGTFNSICPKLDLLHDLGINVIELMPLGEFLGEISAGYNPAYIFAVESEFGGPDGFRKFVYEAHKRGIAVIVDVVYNHLGDPAADMWSFDGWQAEPKGGGIYFYNDWRRETAWGDTRFDYGRPDVRQYLRDNALRWLEERYADGLRWDSVGSLRNVYDRNNDPANDLPDGWSLCQWITGLVHERQPWKISIAEDLKDNPWITKPSSEGGAGFNAQWAVDFFYSLRSAMTNPAGDLGSVASTITQTYNGDAFQRIIYTESHDGVDGGAGNHRIPEAISPGQADSWKAKKLSTLGAAALLTSPGIPMLFMGQEFLSWGAWEANRVMDWSNSWTFRNIRNLYRDLIHLRRNWFNNTRGLRGQNTNLFHNDPGTHTIAYHRWSDGGPGDDVVVILNFAPDGYASLPIGLPRGGMWRVRFHSDWNGYDAFFGNWFSYDTEAWQGGSDALPFSGNIGIGPYSALILSQDS